MQNKLERIILDLDDFSEERYLDNSSKEKIKEIIRSLRRLSIYSTEV